MTPRRFVISDIHGCARTFRALAEKVIRLTPDDFLYILGDCVDRGPRSKELLDIILELRERGFFIRALRGNHEEMLLGSVNSIDDFRLWTANGGRATLDSFGVESVDEIPFRYVAFLSQLPHFIVIDDYVLVHACLNFENRDPFLDREAMLWARHCRVDTTRLGNRKVINGHTPVSRGDLAASLNTPRIMVDNGCVYKGHDGLGSLAALELNTMSVYFQENID